MRNIRLIARLDIKGENLIKGVQMEGLRVVGNPNEFARKYYESGIDEILYMDIVASLYGRNNLVHILEKTVRDVFVPITVGGGIRAIEDVDQLLRAGADKVAINTAAIKNPELITQISRRFGSQCLVLSIEAKKTASNQWEAYTDNGREKTGRNAVDWAIQAQSLGAGEILITSVDREGTRKGFDLELLKNISHAVSIPTIASGGMGESQHIVQAALNGGVDAVAMADHLHYERSSIKNLRLHSAESGLHVRMA